MAWKSTETVDYQIGKTTMRTDIKMRLSLITTYTIMLIIGIMAFLFFLEPWQPIFEKKKKKRS